MGHNGQAAKCKKKTVFKFAQTECNTFVLLNMSTTDTDLAL